MPLTLLLVLSSTLTQATSPTPSAPVTATAIPLEFMGISESTHVKRSHSIACGDLAGLLTCKLTQSSFGGVPIPWSLVLPNRNTGKVSTIAIRTDEMFTETAVRSLTAKYGPPASDQVENAVNKQGVPYRRRSLAWTFVNGGIIVTSDDTNLVVALNFAANKSAPRAPTVDF